MNAALLGCLRSISSDPAQIRVCRNRGPICWQRGQSSSKNWGCRQRPLERRLTMCNSASKPYIRTRTTYPGYVEQVCYPCLCLSSLKAYHFTCSMTLASFLKSGDNRELVFEQLPFNQPLYILYSSGTTGRPKCIVHSAGVMHLLNTSFSLHN